MSVDRLARTECQLPLNLSGFQRIPKLQAEGFAPGELQDGLVHSREILGKSCHLNLPALRGQVTAYNLHTHRVVCGLQPQHLLGAH